MTLLGSVIVGALTLIGVIYQARKSNDLVIAKLDKQPELSDANLKAELAKYQAVTDTKIEELTREVRAHNGHNERIALLEAEDRRLNKRLEILEHKSA